VPNWVNQKIYDKRVERYGKGFLGFWYGTQDLALSFWLIGVLPAVLIYAIGSQALINSRDFSSSFLLYIAILACFRVVAWASIYKCFNNTKSKGLMAFVGVVVVFDVMHKLIVWPLMVILGLNS